MNKKVIVLTILVVSVVSIFVLYENDTEEPISTSQPASSSQEAELNRSLVDGSEDKAELFSLEGTSENEVAVVMVPGLGLDEYIYSETPDGRSGWMTLFNDAGFSSYTYVPANIAKESEYSGNEDKLSQWSLARVWTRWGFGPELETPYKDAKYPTENAQKLADNFPYYGQASGDGSSTTAGRSNSGRAGREAGVASGGMNNQPGAGGSRFGSENSADDLINVLEDAGPAILIVHSAEGPAGITVAKERPDLVEALVVVEPVGCPTETEATPTTTPFLAVYGDYIEERNQTGRKEACEKTVELISEASGQAKMLSLPEEGVYGNSHLMMQDENSDDIAERIITWIRSVRG